MTDGELRENDDAGAQRDARADDHAGFDARRAPDGRSKLVLAVVVPFLNEREHLPSLLASIAAQTRLPDELILVDDGSSDGSYDIAQAFAAEHSFVRVLRRPPRPAEADRLATANELRAFQWGAEHLRPGYQVIAKLDADLELRPEHFSQIAARFEADPSLGLAGAYLSIRLADGSPQREHHAPDHVRGASKFYRRECLEQLSPLPAHLGWDTIDEVKARMYGWRVLSVELPAGDSIHLRPTGLHDGRLRAFWRWGECMYGCGSHPLNVLGGALVRARRPPYLVAGAAYLFGWGAAWARRRPRAEPEVRAFKRREELRRIRTLDGRLPLGRESLSSRS